MSDKSTGGSSGSYEKNGSVDDNNVLDLSIGKIHSHIANGSKGGSKRNGEKKNGKGKRKVEASDDHLLLLTERERRRKMRNMFNQLHALVPQLQSKVYTVYFLFLFFFLMGTMNPAAI